MIAAASLMSDVEMLVLGIAHAELIDDRIVREWTMIDEIAI